MNPKEYTLSKKDKKFLAALAFFQVSLIWLGISLSALFWHNAMLNAFEMKKTYELGKWAIEEVDKVKTEKKLESIKQSYKKQGISADEY